MGKNLFVAVTPGIETQLKNDVLLREDMEEMIKTAVKYSDKSYFIAFHQQNHATIVTDGNYNVLDRLIMPIPENIWIVFEETAAEIICVAMLPREY